MVKKKKKRKDEKKWMFNTYLLGLWSRRGHIGSFSDTGNILFLGAGYISYFIL